MARLLHQLSAWGGSSVPVENIGSQDDCAPSPDRPVRHAKKRLGRLAHLLFAIIPARFQRALGYLPADCMGQSGIPEGKTALRRGTKQWMEIQKSPVRPSGKGSKRKQDDVALEEQQSWVEILQQELPEDDEAEDSTYEPTRSETDSEEYRSQNETETDLEFEEKDGVLVLKESPSLQGTLTGENMLAAASSSTLEQQAAASGGGGDALEQQVAASGGGGDALEQQAAASGGGGDALEQQVAASGGGGDALEQQAAASGGGGDALEQQVAASGGGGDALEQQVAASGGGGDALEQQAAVSGGDWVEVIG